MKAQQYLYSPTKLPAVHLTCWYCDRQLHDERRFCDKACAEAFEQDDLAVERRLLAQESTLALAHT